MSESDSTLTHIESCLVRLHNGDDSAWDELFRHAFPRLLMQCRRKLRVKLTKAHPLITENSVLAETYQRLCTAMRSSNVKPKTAREFFGLVDRHIEWQMVDILRKRAPEQGAEEMFARIPDDAYSESGHEDDEKWALFWSAVEGFSGEEQEVFKMIWMNGLSQYEAAEAIGKTRNQVDSIWRRIKLAIGKACKDYAMLE